MAIHRLSASSPYMEVELRTASGSRFCVALVDTGASMTAVRPGLIDELRPQLIGGIDLDRVGMPREFVPTYYIIMYFSIDSMPVGVEVAAATPSSPCDLLIGRDVMSRWLMAWDGSRDSLVISY